MSARVPEQIGPYQIMRLLGLGGMAQVYHARKVAEGVDLIVALKVPRQHVVMDVEARERFIKEARITARLGSHANITQVLDVGVDGDLPYMAMEYITGVDLGHLCSAMIKERMRWSEPAILWVLASIIQGLRHAWGAEVDGQPLRIVHRDISPSNIMLTHEGYVKVTDFGISRMPGTDTSGTVRGKARYMPYEQILGRATSASDLYAVGAIAWELIEGKPFRHDKTTQDEMLLATFAGETPAITRTDISPRLVEFVMALLRPDEKERIQTPNDAWTELKACPGLNLADPDPLRALLEEFFGQRRRSGYTAIEVRIHPELVATRAALAAAAQAKAEGIADSDGRPVRGQTPEPSRSQPPLAPPVVAQPSAPQPPAPSQAPAQPQPQPPAQPQPVAQPQPPAPSQPFAQPQPPAHSQPIALGHASDPSQPIPITAGPSSDPSQPVAPFMGASSATAPGSAPSAAPWSPPAAARPDAGYYGPSGSTVPQTSQASSELTPAPIPAKRRGSKILVLGAIGLVLGVGMAVTALKLAEKEPPRVAENAAPAAEGKASSLRPKAEPAKPAARAKPAPEPESEPEPEIVAVGEPEEPEAALDPDSDDDSDPEPPEPEADATDDSADRSPDTKADRTVRPPPPKAKVEKATVNVVLNLVRELDLRIDREVKRITGKTTLKFRPGTKTLSISAPGAKAWKGSSRVRFESGRTYLVRLYPDRIDVIPVPGS